MINTPVYEEAMMYRGCMILLVDNAKKINACSGSWNIITILDDRFI